MNIILPLRFNDIFVLEKFTIFKRKKVFSLMKTFLPENHILKVFYHNKNYKRQIKEYLTEK